MLVDLIRDWGFKKAQKHRRHTRECFHKHCRWSSGRLCQVRTLCSLQISEVASCVFRNSRSHIVSVFVDRSQIAVNSPLSTSGGLQLMFPVSPSPNVASSVDVSWPQTQQICSCSATTTSAQCDVIFHDVSQFKLSWANLCLPVCITVSSWSKTLHHKPENSSGEVLSVNWCSCQNTTGSQTNAE